MKDKIGHNIALGIPFLFILAMIVAFLYVLYDVLRQYWLETLYIVGGFVAFLLVAYFVGLLANKLVDKLE